MYVVLSEPCVRRLEVVDAQEHPDSTGELLADGIALVVTIGSGEQDASLGARRFHDHPSLRAAIVGGRRRILDEFEPEGLGVERDRLVVVVDDDRSQLDVHPDDSRPRPFNRRRVVPTDPRRR